MPQSRSEIQLAQDLFGRICRHPATPAILLFLTNLFLIAPAFFPSLADLGVWDQPAYLAAGQQLMDEGNYPVFAGNPLTSLFYGLMYLPFRSSPLWMVHSCTLGRFLLFTLLWLALYLIGKELSNLIPPLLLPGILLVTPLAVEVMTFPSDPLFAGLAGLSFWQLLRFAKSRDHRAALYASALLGLSALARNDGVVLFPIFLVLIALLNRGNAGWKRIALASIVPYAALVGGYILIYGFVTGNFDPGTAARTYDNFESGQFLIESSGNINNVIDVRLQAREIFGTPEENHSNVFLAISRNPAMYLERVRRLLRDLPRILLQAYGKRFAPLLFLLALQGIWALIKQRAFRQLALFLLWPAHLLTGFIITIFRPGHLTFVYFIVYALAAIGLASWMQYPIHWKNRGLWAAALLLLGLYGILDEKLAFFYAALVFLLVEILISTLQIRSKERATLVSLLILAAAGIVLRQGFPSPIQRNLGESEPEQAVIFMTENLPAGSIVAAGSPGYIQAARLGTFVLAATDTPYDLNSADFIEWIKDQGVDYLFADYSLVAENASLWALIEPGIGEQFELLFTSSGGDIRIYSLSGEEPCK